MAGTVSQRVIRADAQSPVKARTSVKIVIRRARK